jgi:DNA-binding transcriptional LysR family regulator
MNLYHLRVFLAVAEHEHITKASGELYLSQPAVTKIIQHLEQEVGMELIERHGRRIVLTDAGRLLHEYARRIFALEREMEDALAALQGVGVGKVHLAANTTMGVYLLPPVVAKFRELYPKVELGITILNSHEIIEEILNWEIDFGLVEGDPSTLPPGLYSEVFTQDELVLVVAPTHHWSSRDAVLPGELAEGALLLREKGSGIRESIEHMFLQYGVQIQPLLTLPDNEAIKQMVMNGVGAAFVSALAVKRELVGGELVRIPIDGIELRPPLSLARRADKRLSRAAEAFCALLRGRAI